jgi:hypothetical protein
MTIINYILGFVKYSEEKGLRQGHIIDLDEEIVDLA